MNRRIFLAPGEVIEVLAQQGESLAKLQLLIGEKGNPQILVWSQPTARLWLDPAQSEIPFIRAQDLLPEEDFTRLTVD